MKRRGFLRAAGLGVSAGALGMPETAHGQSGARQAGGLPAPVNDVVLRARSERDPRVRTYVWPERVVWQTPEGQGLVENAEVLLERRTGQVTLGKERPFVLRGNGGQPGVLLDFGRELQGGVQLIVWNGGEGKNNARLRVRFGESASEAMSGVGGPQNATNDHAMRDFTTEVGFLMAHEVGTTGFRFVRIDLLDPEGFVEFKSIRAVFVYRDLEYKGAFRCSDARLNKIWDTGAYTVHLNMQDYLWDGIKRDRLVWIGDMHPEVSTIHAVFGGNEVVPKSLDLIRDETPLPGWMNGICSYSLWWILIHRDWYLHHGDLAYLGEQRPYLTGLLENLLTLIGPDNQEKLPPHRFLDWPTSENEPAIHAGLHALLILGLEAGADLCGVLGEGGAAKSCRAGVERLRLYTPDPAGSKQAAALMALAGVADAETMNREVMAADGARRMSTFYGYYVLLARAKAGDIQGCLDVIREYWGAMLDLGATTFWEDFNLDWAENAAGIADLVPPGKKDIHGDFGAYCYLGFRHSLCHGWASGPTAWLTRHVLGVEVLEPGCSKVRIAPQLGDLAWAEGSFPAPHGVIRIKHRRRGDGSIESDIDAPDGIEIVHG